LTKNGATTLQILFKKKEFAYLGTNIYLWAQLVVISDIQYLKFKKSLVRRGITTSLNKQKVWMAVLQKTGICSF